MTHQEAMARLKWIQEIKNMGKPLFVSRMYGNKAFKWRSYPDEEIYLDTNQRQIAIQEIVLDIEIPKYKDIIVQRLKDFEISNEVWRSGGKGYHIHIFYDQLGDIPEEKRSIAKKLISEYILGAIFNAREEIEGKIHEVIDKQKFNSKTLIQLEFSNHRKTQNEKTLEDKFDFGNNKIPEAVLDQINSLPVFEQTDLNSNRPSYLPAGLIRLETKCQAVCNMLQRRDLNHRERTALLFLFMPFGNGGEERLIEILSQQNNYNPAITRVQIENYRQKGIFKGISCKKLQEWNVCRLEGNCKDG